VMSPYIGGGFGGKLFLRATPCWPRSAPARPGGRSRWRCSAALMNNTTHRPATIQRIRIGATRTARSPPSAMRAGRAICLGRQAGDRRQADPLLYAGANRMTAMRVAVLDLPEGNAMRAPGEAPGLMALEIAMDEMAEKLGIDPGRVPHRQRHPGRSGKAERPSRSASWSNACAPRRALRLEQAQSQPGQMRDGRWLVGMGVAAAFRNNLLTKSAARVRLDGAASSRSKPT
jgi:xanthine dehydrogenase YagR molybdenum-binding subunit